MVGQPLFSFTDSPREPHHFRSCDHISLPELPESEVTHSEHLQSTSATHQQTTTTSRPLDTSRVSFVCCSSDHGPLIHNLPRQNDQSRSYTFSRQTSQKLKIQGVLPRGSPPPTPAPIPERAADSLPPQRGSGLRRCYQTFL